MKNIKIKSKKKKENVILKKYIGKINKYHPKKIKKKT